jgi:PAS domain S-box-containing protein
MIRGGAVMLALAFSVPAVAQEYSFRVYGAAEGLQNMVVLSLAQDHAGYIWAGTEGGLYRYDGNRFQLTGPAMGLPCSTETHGLYVAQDGALWANTCAKIFRFDGQRFQVIPGVNALRRGAQVMADGANGSVLITTSRGLYEASPAGDGSFSMHPYRLPATLAGKRMYGILRQGARLWFGCDQQLCLEEGGRVSVFGPEQGLPADMWDGIQLSNDGSVWAHSPKSIYRRAAGQTMFSQEYPDIASSGFWGALTLGRDGSVMVPTDKGLAIRTAAGWSIVNRQRGLSKDVTAAVLEDREGSVWIGLVGGGVARWLERGDWESWKMDQGLPSDLIWSIRRDRKGALWVGTGLGLVRLDGSSVTRSWTRQDGLGGDNVRWLAETSDGSIWAATKPGGLARIDPVTGKIRHVDRTDGLPCDPEDVYVDRHDRLWVPTACGLFRNDRPSVSNRFIRLDTPESLNRRALKILEDSQGTIWVANPDGLWSLREGQWRMHRRADWLLTDSPYVMALARDGSIWLRHRYDAGVDRIEVSGDRIVRATAIVTADPKSVEVTAFHGFDAFGNFWRGGANGVAVRRGETWTTFTTEDGLVWNDCDGEAFWADADGSVWLGTSGGLSRYHSGNGGPHAPLVADPTITRLKLVESARLIRAEFSTMNYKAEQLVHFAYRLDDEPWTDSVERNISIAGLGPGRHRLEVRSRVRDDPFSPRIAAADFLVKPTWGETWWVRLLALAFGMAAISQFVRWRLRASARRQAELEAIVADRDLSNRALDEKARLLRSSEDRLRLLFQQTPAGIFLFDMDLRVTECNDQFLSLLQCDREAVVGLHLSMLKEPEILPAFQAALAGTEGSYEGPCTLRTVFGCSWVALSTVPLLDENRQIKGGIGVAVDMSERKRAEAALRESEERFRRVFEEGPLGLALVGEGYRFLKVNGALCQMSGYPEAELLQMSFGDITHPDDLAADVEFADRLLKGDIPFCQQRKRCVSKKGEIIWISLTASLIRDREGEPIHGLAMIEDITEVKRNQEAGLARQKLESVGILAGGIAHDFNNLLGGILAQAELGEVDLSAGSSPVQELHRIKEGAIRGAEIVRQLMIFAGEEQATLMEPVDLSPLVEEMLGLLSVSISKRAVLITNLEKDMPAVWGNAPKIRQVVMNLVINASEALGEKEGEIRVTTSYVTVGRDSLLNMTAHVPPGECVQLEVSDTGRGMTGEVRAKILDPYFTTKFAGRGLGLSVVQGVVRDHGGALDVVSAPGQGATFRVLLPCTSERASVTGSPVIPSGTAQSNSERTIIVVEDEEMLRLAVSKALRKRGFSVLEAGDGSAAMQLIRAHGDDIDVVLLDVTLPGVSSREILEEIARTRPDLKVIVTSAYGEETVSALFARLRVERFIRKPFRLGDLVQLVSDTLSS